MKLHAFMVDPALCGSEFAGPSWATWRVIARLLDGDAHLLSADELALAQALTGRQTFPTVPPPELFVGCGRRAGKTRFSAILAVHAAAQTYSALGRGEQATVAIVAPDRRQARLAFDYAAGLVTSSDILRAELTRQTTETLEFRHNTRLEVHTGSFRSVRGYSMALAIVDEASFLRDENSAVPDIELARALRPALATLGGRLIVISSPHRRTGLLYEGYQKYFGHDEARSLYVQAKSTSLNPLLSQELIERAVEDDPEAASSEWFGLFRSDISEYLPDTLIDAAVVPDRIELPFQSDRGYSSFVDMSGGVSDSAALAISHIEPGTKAENVVLDQLHVVPAPHEPAEIVRRFAAILQRFGIHSVTGDKYAARWTVDAFRTCGITYEASELDKSGVYSEVARLFAEKRVELLDNKLLITQLRSLERKPRAGGRPDSIDHGPRQRDDASNAVAGSLWLSSSRTVAPSDHLTEVTHALRDHDPWAPVPEIRPSPRHAHLLPANLHGRYEPDYSQSLRDHDSLK